MNEEYEITELSSGKEKCWLCSGGQSEQEPTISISNMKLRLQFDRHTITFTEEESQMMYEVLKEVFGE